jgi:hypothetical protein
LDFLHDLLELVESVALLELDLKVGVHPARHLIEQVLMFTPLTPMIISLYLLRSPS